MCALPSRDLRVAGWHSQLRKLPGGPLLSDGHVDADGAQLRLRELLPGRIPGSYCVSHHDPTRGWLMGES